MSATLTTTASCATHACAHRPLASPKLDILTPWQRDLCNQICDGHTHVNPQATSYIWEAHGDCGKTAVLLYARRATILSGVPITIRRSVHVDASTPTHPTPAPTTTTEIPPRQPDV